MALLRIKQKAKIHNKFHLVLTDAKTGRVKQEAWAYNILLNRFFGANGTSGSIFHPYYSSVRYFGTVFSAIRVGSGTGELSPSRQDLFTPLAAKAIGEADLFDRTYNFDLLQASVTMRAIWNETELQNTTIREIGYANGTGVNVALSHALLQDSEGNPIALNKGQFDVLTVYATIFVQLVDNYNSQNFGFVQGTHATYRNGLLDLFFRNANLRSGFTSERAFALNLGTSGSPVSATQQHILTSVLQIRHDQNVASDTGWISTTFSYANKNLLFKYRIQANQANTTAGIKEIGLRFWQHAHGFGPGAGLASMVLPVFRSVLPLSNVFTGRAITGEEIGTGDGAQTVFTTQWAPIKEASSPVVYVNGVEQQTGVTVNKATGQVTFNVAPAAGTAVTIDYYVEFIPKDANHVLDIEFAIQFADGNAV